MAEWPVGYDAEKSMEMSMLRSSKVWDDFEVQYPSGSSFPELAYRSAADASARWVAIAQVHATNMLTEAIGKLTGAIINKQ